MAEAIKEKQVSPRRRPGSIFPLRTKEALLERHAKILELWRGCITDSCHECGHPIQRRRTKKEVALAVGLRHPFTMYRHVQGKCRCEL